MLPWVLTSAIACALSSPAFSEREAAGEIAHWVFDQAHHTHGAFTPLKGDWNAPTLFPAFAGEPPYQALLLPPGRMEILIDPALSSSSLPKEDICVEAWVVMDTNMAWGGIFSALEDNGSHERGVLLGTRDRNFCFAVASEGKGSLTYLASTKPYKKGVWYHVVGTYDGELMRLYQNGELVAESAEQTGPILYQNTHSLALCSYKDENESYPIVGAIHEVTLYDKALKLADIKRRYKHLEGKLPKAAGSTINGLPEEKGTPLYKLQPAINKAITDGVDGLLMSQHRDGSWNSRLDAYRNGTTALCVYTLLKCGLQNDHPAVVRGLQFLKKAEPTKTYSLGCQLMAIGATKDEANKEWAEELTELLLDWESDAKPGSWGYPHGEPDVSNAQFAALGFWGASELGVEIPVKTWRRLVETTANKHQTFIEEVEWPEDSSGSKRTGKQQIAGFHYYDDRAPWSESGCMTTAGLCAIGIPMMLLEKKLGARHSQMFMKSSRLGMGWLEAYYLNMWDDLRHVRVDGVDTAARGICGDNFYYYIYGLERVGAFFNTEFIGDHPWYRDGAEQLLKRQDEPGVWGNKFDDTCFALLFLRRASMPVPSGKAADRSADVFADSTGEVHIRATGTKTMTFWVEGVDESVLSEFEKAGRLWRGLRVLKTEYLADGKLVATVPGDTTTPWRGERFAAQWKFELPGEHVLQARVTAVTPEGDPEYPNRTEVFSSVALKILTFDSPEDWMADNLEFSGENLLSHSLFNARASSERDGCGAGLAFDPLHSTHWASKEDDQRPWIQLSLTKRERANAIVLAQANSTLGMRGQFGAIKKVALSVNGDDPIEVDLGVDEMKMTLVDLGKTQRISDIKITVLESTPGSTKSVGFSGIELLRQ